MRRQVMADTSNADGLGQIVQAKKLFRQDQDEDEEEDDADNEEDDDGVTELTAKVYSGGEEVIPPR